MATDGDTIPNIAKTNKQKEEKLTNADSWENSNPGALLAGMSNDVVLMKNCLKISQKFNSEFLHGPSILLWAHFPKDQMP